MDPDMHESAHDTVEGEVISQWSDLARAARVAPGSRVHLESDYDPARHDPRLTKDSGAQALAQAVRELEQLQDRFYAQADTALLIVLQAIDAAGKDGTIKHVMSGLNPEGVVVYSFKAPTTIERSHDFLWRHQRALPELGRIAVFNRSHYENVLVTRVHPHLLWPANSDGDLDALWKKRFRAINEWERHLSENGTVIVKLFLHLSKAEQKRRFLQRLERPEKNWKFSAADIEERAYWNDYQHAFEQMLSNTSTEWAPWHVIPADHKWFSHLSTSAVLLETLHRINPQYPTASQMTKAAVEQAKSALLAEPD
jgi:PPK2 family polyphosphate:nucleotide phosphotransferase